jgi:hypothetical protein
MATHDFALANPPKASRARGLWLEHVAGFILFEDVRRYALERVDPALPDAARAAAERAIDDALCGLMMVIDGVSGTLSNAKHRVALDLVARLVARETDELVTEVPLRDGDGMCMGYHGWREGNFGERAVAVPK